MKTYSFKGGIHPPESKHTAAVATEVIPIPKQVAIPLLQHIGAPCTTMVKVGDSIKTGQKIGESGGFVSAPVHSSVTGKVSAIANVPHPIGKMVSAVVIDSEESDNWENGTNVETSWETTVPTDLKGIIQESGIVGMGGAAFPTHVKLSPPAGKHIDTLIINGAECEPYLTADYRLMMERAEDIITGTEILMRVLEIEKAYIGIEKNKIEAYSKLSEMTANFKEIECCLLKTKYPQGGEKQLINAITKRQVPSRGLPMDCGCVVQNLGTTIAVKEAICQRKPLIERIVTVTGPGVATPKNLKVRIGTRIEELLEACGGLKEGCVKVISGGPMMGIAQWSLETPVIKATSGLLCLTGEEVAASISQPCISCSACLRACPIHLMPTRIVQNVELKRWEATNKLGILDCMECGSCSYVCPSKINLVHFLKWGKAEVMEIAKKAKQKQNGK